MHFLAGSRVRVATLNLALFLLVLVTRDSSRRCQLTENHRQQAQTAFIESRTLLQNLFMVSHLQCVLRRDWELIGNRIDIDAMGACAVARPHFHRSLKLALFKA